MVALCLDMAGEEEERGREVSGLTGTWAGSAGQEKVTVTYCGKCLSENYQKFGNFVNFGGFSLGVEKRFPDRERRKEEEGKVVETHQQEDTLSENTASCPPRLPSVDETSRDLSPFPAQLWELHTGSSWTAWHRFSSVLPRDPAGP